MPEASLVLGSLANGLVFGSVLALGAIGLTLVYGILRISNFAHGDFVTLGAFLALLLTVEQGPLLPYAAGAVGLSLGAFAILGALQDRLRPGETWILAALGFFLLVGALWMRSSWDPSAGTTNGALAVATGIAIVVSVAVALLLEFAVWRPLRRRGGTLLTFVIASIGVALVLRNVLQLRFGGGNRSFDRPTPVSDLLLGVRISEAQQFALAASLVLMLVLHLFLRRTRTGKAMRALADNPDLARASGIDVDRTILYVWAIAAALTGIAGVLLALVLNNNMHVNMGFHLLLPLFASVILGGIGSVYGAILGAFVIGLAMETSVLWLGSEYDLATAFVLLVVVLLVRPRGILGGRA